MILFSSSLFNICSVLFILSNSFIVVKKTQFHGLFSLSVTECSACCLFVVIICAVGRLSHCPSSHSICDMRVLLHYESLMSTVDVYS